MMSNTTDFALQYASTFLFSHIRFSKLHNWLDTLTLRLGSILVLLLLLWVIFTPSMLNAIAGVGDYISEKLLGDAATSDAFFTLGDGTNEQVVAGMGPIVTTTAASDVALSTAPTAILRGTLSDLNGFPQADVWFEWGYSASTLTNVTPTVTATVTGEQTATITGFESQRIYYQIVAGTDAEVRGDILSFAGGRAAGYVLMWNILTAVVAAGTIILTLQLTGNPIASLLSAIIGIIAIQFIRSVLEAFI